MPITTRTLVPSFGINPARNIGTTPAITRDLLPLPDTPVTASRRRWPKREATSRISLSLPKNKAACCSSNGKRPRNGLLSPSIPASPERDECRRSGILLPADTELRFQLIRSCARLLSAEGQGKMRSTLLKFGGPAAAVSLQ